MQSRIDNLDDGARDALELLALGEPLEIDVAEVLGIIYEFSELERRGVVVMVPETTTITLTHPLFGELTRVSIGDIGRRSLNRRISEAMEELMERELLLGKAHLGLGDVKRGDAHLQNAAALARTADELTMVSLIQLEETAHRGGSLYPIRDQLAQILQRVDDEQLRIRVEVNLAEIAGWQQPWSVGVELMAPLMDNPALAGELRMERPHSGASAEPRLVRSKTLSRRSAQDWRS